jgi:CRP/FNR family transcriptional regulator, cyclic AMP receptor protein
MAFVGVNAMIDADLRTAIGGSRLRDLRPELIAKLTAEARKVRIRAGATIHYEGESEPHLELVMAGLVRAHVSAPDGRTRTVRYCRPGALMGVATPTARSGMTGSGP